MKITMHYVESARQWQNRGYANNVHLIIYPDKKQFVYVTNYIIPDLTAFNNIEVKRKSDLSEMVTYLQNEGFQEVKSI